MLRPNGGGAAAAALSGGKKKKPNRENAYMLFSRVVREDMYQKFGGLQRFNEHFATHYQNEQDEGRIKIPSVKMAVIGNLWSEAPPGVRAFFERAAERKNAWDDAKGLAGANAGSDEDIPIGRTRPQGGGKAHKIDHKNASATGGPAVNAKEGTRSLAVDARVDFGAQEKPGGKGTQVKQAAKKSTPMETVDTRVAGSRRESGGRSESKDDPDSPHATAAKVATAEGGKRGPSALESLPIAPGPAVSYDANSKTSTGVAKGVDQAAALSAKNEAKRRDHGERTDAAGEQKSAAGVPRDGKASERNVQGVAPKGRDKGKAPGEGKQAEEEENLANAKGETRLPSAAKAEETAKRPRSPRTRRVRHAFHPRGSGTAKAGAVGGVVGEEKAAKDDRKSNSTGHGTSGGNATHRNDKSDKKESASSLGKSRGDLSASTGGKVKSGRREHGGEGGGGEKTKGSEEKRGETAAASEGSNAEERSRDKGKWKEKTKSAEKRKSIAEGKAIKGASKGGPSVGKASSVSSAKPRASPTEEAKVAKDPRRAPATKGPQRKEARSTNLDSRTSVATNSTKRKEARQPASSVPIASRGRRGGKEAAANAETSDNSSTPKDLTYFGLERGERVAIEVEWPVEVQKGGRKTEERLEWFSATVDLHKQLRADEEGRPKWTIHYARHGSLPASKSKVTFLGGDRLMDDYEDDPLRWRRKGSPLSTSEADSSPRRAGSAGGSSVGSSADHEVEWRDDFGLKPRRRS
ncbi:unnamed protein product [Ascophyllum nodosum]